MSANPLIVCVETGEPYLGRVDHHGALSRVLLFVLRPVVVTSRTITSRIVIGRAGADSVGCFGLVEVGTGGSDRHGRRQVLV